jgi:hypothetical protein
VVCWTIGEWEVLGEGRGAVVWRKEMAVCVRGAVIARGLGVGVGGCGSLLSVSYGLDASGFGFE